jgi:hypothetical protein
VVGILFCTAGFARAGIPLGVLVNYENDLYAMLVDFNEQYTAAEAEQSGGFLLLGLGLVAQEYANAVTVLAPEDLAAAGFSNAASLHTLIVQNLSIFDVYILAQASKVSGPEGVNLRFDLTLWIPGTANGVYIGALEMREDIDQVVIGLLF